jgi:hypothetical protein
MMMAIAGCCPWAISNVVTTPAPNAAGSTTSSKAESDLFRYITFTAMSDGDEKILIISQQLITRLDRSQPNYEILQLILINKYNSSFSG